MAAIVWTDLAVGMQVTTTLTQDATGAYTEHTDTVTSVDAYSMHLSSGAIITRDPGDGTTLALDKVADPPVTIPAEPANGTIVTDETGAAWQALASDTTGGNIWYSINGDQLTWADFYTAHPAYTPMQNEPIVPLPAPTAPYPTTITPDAARLGMDIRVTANYDAGGSKVVRGICTWNQDNGVDKTDGIPDFLILSLSTGDVWQYNPVPDGQTLLVEQLQDWTADTVWDISGIPEPPVGAIVRSRSGIAWQHTADATADGPLIDGTGPWYLAGQGMWSSVTGDYPRSFLWLWGAAAPFNVQETAP